MRIACPTCDATYEVPDALIGAGRRLRCAKCAHEWLVQPESPAVPAGPVPAAPAAEAVPPMSAPRRPEPAVPPPEAAAGQRDGRAARMALWAAWIGSGLVLAAAVAGAWAYRDPIMGAWPPAARVYLLFGAA